MSERARGKILHGQLHLLDRQIVEHGTGRMVAKVDDVEIDLSGEHPLVSGLLTGPAAWGARLPGVLGRVVTGVHRRLHPAEDPQPHVIDASHIVEVDSAVHVDSADLGTRGLGGWLDAHVIGRIPGARHATE